MRNTPHSIEVLRRQLVDEVDGVPLYDWPRFTVVPGWFSFLDAEELSLWQEQRVTASARIPPTVALLTTDRMRVLSPLHRSLAGQWNVVTVRYAGEHLRAMLRRTSA